MKKELAPTVFDRAMYSYDLRVFESAVGAEAACDPPIAAMVPVQENSQSSLAERGKTRDWPDS
jgi:hypothetical protein